MAQHLPLGSLDVPDDWEDRSTYQFVGPADPSLEIPLVGGRGERLTEARPAVVLTRAALPQGPLETALKAQAEQYAQALAAFKLQSREPWKHPVYGEAPAIEFSFQLGPTHLVQQVQIYVVEPGGKYAVVLTFSCDTRSFAKRRASFESLFASFRLTER